MKPWGPGGKGGTQSKLATHSKHHHPVDHGEFLSTGCPDEPPASHTCSADRLPISKSMSRKRPSEAPLMTLEADRDQQLLPDRGGHGASHRSLTRLRLLGCVFEIRACIPAETICHDCCIAATLCGTPDAAGTVTGIPVLLSRDIRVAAVCALANPPTLVESLSGTLMPLVRN